MSAAISICANHFNFVSFIYQFGINLSLKFLSSVEYFSRLTQQNILFSFSLCHTHRSTQFIFCNFACSRTNFFLFFASFFSFWLENERTRRPRFISFRYSTLRHFCFYFIFVVAERTNSHCARVDEAGGRMNVQQR